MYVCALNPRVHGTLANLNALRSLRGHGNLILVRFIVQWFQNDMREGRLVFIFIDKVHKTILSVPLHGTTVLFASDVCTLTKDAILHSI